MAVHARADANDPSCNANTWFSNLLSRGLCQFDELGLSIEQLENMASVGKVPRDPAATMAGLAHHQENMAQNLSTLQVEASKLFKRSAAAKRSRRDDDADGEVALLGKKPFAACVNSGNYSIMSSAGGKGNHPVSSSAAPFRPSFSVELQFQMSRHKQEIDQLLETLALHWKQALDEIRMKHSKEIINVVDAAMETRLRLAVDALNKAMKKNIELEETARQLCMQAQLWQNLARNNELMAFNLRHSLELVLAQVQARQSNGQLAGKGGHGETGAEDAQSCCGDGGDAMPSIEADTEARKCKVCRCKEVCMLLLPCRHLCLCTACVGALEACPMCSSPKNASVRVYMD